MIQCSLYRAATERGHDSHLRQIREHIAAAAPGSARPSAANAMHAAPVTISALYALHGKARLRLTGVRLGDEFRFNAMAYEYLHEDECVIKTIITREQFQTGCPNLRQIVALHEFASYGDWAILQVAEHHDGFGMFPPTIVYSWRQWDLNRNVEIDHLKTSRTALAFHERHDTRLHLARSSSLNCGA